jgi:hypothetical protein
MRGDDSFSHAEIIDLANDGRTRAGVTARLLCRYHPSMRSARRFPPCWRRCALPHRRAKLPDLLKWRLVASSIIQGATERKRLRNIVHTCG